MDTKETLDYLDGRRFSAAELKLAAGIDQGTLSNYTTKTELILCSEPLGQGRGRQFCLIDVYQIALLRRMVGMTRDAIWSAAALNYLLFIEPEMEALACDLSGKGSLSAEQVEAIVSHEVCRNIRAANRVYWHRDILDPYFMSATELAIVTRMPRLDFGRRGDLDFGAAWDSGMIWNVTSHLRAVDERLAQCVLARPQQQVGTAEVMTPKRGPKATTKPRARK